MRNKEGYLEMCKSDGMKKKWKSYRFKVSGSTYLLYFKDKVSLQTSSDSRRSMINIVSSHLLQFAAVLW